MSAEVVVTLIIAVVGSNGLWSFAQFLIGRKKNKFSYDDVMEFKNGLCALLRNEIVCAHRTYTSLGYCPLEDKTNISEMYQAYHKLGGNDIATALKNQILELPNTKEERRLYETIKQDL